MSLDRTLLFYLPFPRAVTNTGPPGPLFDTAESKELGRNTVIHDELGAIESNENGEKKTAKEANKRSKTKKWKSERKKKDDKRLYRV